MSFDRTTWARESARRHRAAALAAKNATATVCQKGQGRAICGGLLVATTDGAGGVVVSCRQCERQARGICRDCERRVAGTIGRALRCADCRAVESIRAGWRWRTRYPAKMRRSGRRYYQRDAARRKARNEYKRAWRKANPDKVQAQKRRYVERGRSRQYQAARRATTPPVRQVPRLEPRTCVTPGCDIVVTHRKKKCTKCKARDRAVALAQLATLERSA